MSDSAGVANHPAEPAGARPSDQAMTLDAQALAQLSGALRLVSDDVQASVDRFSDPHMMAAGKVNIISVEAVQQRFGARWSLRKDQVFAFTERVLQRGVATSGVYIRVSDTDFFIIQPELGRLAGQAACLRYLREVLNHFLGESHMAAAGVMQVTRMTRGRMEARPVDARQMEAVESGSVPAEEAEAAQASALLPDHEGDLETSPGGLNPWTPFVSGDGRHIRVSATLEPVYELKGFTRIGFRMIRRVIVIATGEELTAQQVAGLSSGDILRTDLATITRGIDRLKVEAEGEQQLSLIVPLSFSSLSTQRGRTELIAPLKEAGGLVRLGVVCEIHDIEGVPPGALLAAASLVRPFSLLVVGRLAGSSLATVERLRGAGLQALSLECPPGLGDAEFLGWASTTIAAARKVAKSVLIYRAGTPKRAGALASFGATHASLAAA
ncbi:hypothetical protein [Phenylobacterium sp.]|uniref:hypothetical protein n=1 Tax=Phenylobacterium sp. TaxID=1871053 RepID=UPI002E35815F|nr:hypothetical protein [Phenylobacterium sp.]HEX4712150.1 hypothetical protein [Phenylobacterium sp.]